MGHYTLLNRFLGAFLYPGRPHLGRDGHGNYGWIADMSTRIAERKVCTKVPLWVLGDADTLQQNWQED